MIYTNSRRAELAGQGLKTPAISKQTGEEWKAMDDKAKEKYIGEQKKDAERYDREMAEWKEKEAAAGGQEDE